VGPRGNLREIVITFTKGKDDTLADDWIGGRYDVLQAPDARARDAPATLVEVIPELALTYVGFRPDVPPFSNPLVRKAFSHAVDREALRPEAAGLVRAATRGGAIPPAMPGHSHRIGPAYDLGLARRLLAEAGYPDGNGLPELSMVVTTWADFAEALAAQWGELGARVRIRRAREHLWAADLDDEELWLSGWTADYPDPDGFFRGLFSQSTASAWPFYVDDEIRELVSRARSLQDQDERMRLYHEVDRLWVAEHAAILPLFYGRSMIVRRPWVEGLWATPLTRLQFDNVVVRPH
jgi:oligopeptide transport system substrate-binding protein